MEIADVIKTLDMSLPSYSDTSSYKATVETTKSLSVSSAPATPEPPKKTAPMSPEQKKIEAARKAEKAKKYSSVPQYDF